MVLVVALLERDCRLTGCVGPMSGGVSASSALELAMTVVEADLGCPDSGDMPCWLQGAP